MKTLQEVEDKYVDTYSKLLLSNKCLDAALLKSVEIKNELKLVFKEFVNKNALNLEEDIKKMKEFSLNRLALEEQKILQEVLRLLLCDILVIFKKLF